MLFAKLLNANKFYNSCSNSLFVFSRFSFKRPHWNQYMPKGYVNEKFTFLKPFHILSNLVIQICTLANSSWVHQSCAVQNNYSDPVFGVLGIVPNKQVPQVNKFGDFRFCFYFWWHFFSLILQFLRQLTLLLTFQEF